MLLELTINDISKKFDLDDLLSKHFLNVDFNSRNLLMDFDHAFSSSINLSYVCSDFIGTSFVEPRICPLPDICTLLTKGLLRILQALYKIFQCSILKSIFGKIFFHA